MQDGSTYYRAPFYLTSTVLGMAALILVPRWLSNAQDSSAPIRERSADPIEEEGGSASGQAMAGSAADAPIRTERSSLLGGGKGAGGGGKVPPSIAAEQEGSVWVGYLLAVGSGTLAAVHYGLVTYSQKVCMPAHAQRVFY